MTGSNQTRATITTGTRYDASNDRNIRYITIDFVGGKSFGVDFLAEADGAVPANALATILRLLAENIDKRLAEQEAA